MEHIEPELSTNSTLCFVSISKQELATLPCASFTGQIVIVDNDADAVKAAECLRQESLIGFDTETKPSFKRGQTNNVSLLQLSTHDTCFLIRLNHIGLHPDIKQILESKSQTKIGVSIHDDFHNLRKLYDLQPDGFIDLQSYVKNFDIRDNSLSRIYGILFGHRISKGQRLTNWEAAHLTTHQQDYAALDAFACIQIYEYLSSNRFDPTASPYYGPVETAPSNDTSKSASSESNTNVQKPEPADNTEAKSDNAKVKSSTAKKPRRTRKTVKPDTAE